LQLLCSCNTPVRKKLDYWPQIPIAINDKALHDLTPTQEDNLLAAFEISNCVYSVTLALEDLLMKKIVMMMQKPFPMLTYLWLSSHHFTLPIKFLGEHAPCLQEITLTGLSGPPNFFVSTSDLVELHLFCLQDPLPSSKAMVKGLAAMIRLKSLAINICVPSNTRQTQTQLPVAQAVLPSLNQFQFNGPYRYLENLVSKLNTPQLFDLTIQISICSEFNLQVPNIFQFIDHAKGLKQAKFTHANIQMIRDINVDMVIICLNNAWAGKSHIPHLTLKANHPCQPNPTFNLNWQLQLVKHLLIQASAIISTTHHLSVVILQKPRMFEGIKKAKINDDTKFFRLLEQFHAVKTLHIERQLTKLLFPAPTKSAHKLIQVTKVLPALHLLNLEGLSPRSLKQLQLNFKKQLRHHPLTVIENQEEFERLKMQLL